MRTYVRVTESFDPGMDLITRHPGWAVIQTTSLSNGDTELFFPADQTVFLDHTACGLDWALAHVTAHLDLGHHLDCPEGFTEAQEAAASWLAAMRMDYRPCEKPALDQQPLGFHALEDFPMDGPPSVAL